MRCTFEGKEHFRFSLEIDYALQEITVRIADPKTTGMEVENLALTGANLGALGRLMCSVKEGKAVVPVYLLAQLAVICHGYQRLVQELDDLHDIKTTTGSVSSIEAELRTFLTPEEQKRTDNPLLAEKGKDNAQDNAHTTRFLGTRLLTHSTRCRLLRAFDALSYAVRSRVVAYLRRMACDPADWLLSVSGVLFSRKQ